MPARIKASQLGRGAATADLNLRARIVTLGVRDLSRSLEFYRDTLGLRVKARAAGVAFLDAGGGITLTLNEAQPGPRQRLAGSTQVMFSVPGVQTAYEELQRRGVRFIDQPHSVNAKDWAVAFIDPDGHSLAILGPEREP